MLKRIHFGLTVKLINLNCYTIVLVCFLLADHSFRLLNVNSNYTHVPRRHFNNRAAHRYTGIGSLNRQYLENRNALNLKLGSFFKKEKPSESDKIKNLLGDESLSNDEKQRIKVSILQEATHIIIRVFVLIQSGCLCRRICHRRSQVYDLEETARVQHFSRFAWNNPYIGHFGFFHGWDFWYK